MKYLFHIHKQEVLFEAFLIITHYVSSFASGPKKQVPDCKKKFHFLRISNYCCWLRIISLFMTPLHQINLCHPCITQLVPVMCAVALFTLKILLSPGLNPTTSTVVVRYINLAGEGLHSLHYLTLSSTSDSLKGTSVKYKYCFFLIISTLHKYTLCSLAYFQCYCNIILFLNDPKILDSGSSLLKSALQELLTLSLQESLQLSSCFFSITCFPVMQLLLKSEYTCTFFQQFSTELIQYLELVPDKKFSSQNRSHCRSCHCDLK